MLLAHPLELRSDAAALLGLRLFVAYFSEPVLPPDLAVLGFRCVEPPVYLLCWLHVIADNVGQWEIAAVVRAILHMRVDSPRAVLYDDQPPRHLSVDHFLMT